MLQGGGTMSRMLNLVDRLLARGRKFHEIGREHDALVLLSRLAGFGELPAEVAEETQARLAEIQLRRRKFVRARRHLTAALLHRPDSARYHYLLATACNTHTRAHTRGDEQRALEHYRRSLQLDPDQPRCLLDLGMLAVRLGQTEEGLRCLHRAAELAPNDPHVIGKLAAGLREAGQPEEARRALRSARFRNPRDRRFLRLWNDFQFRQLREAQEAARRADLSGNGDDEPVLLPFVRPAHDSGTRLGAHRVIRLDPGSPPAAPHWPLPARRSDRKHAQ
jgi:Flp pilus assembly protein TadD